MKLTQVIDRSVRDRCFAARLQREVAVGAGGHDLGVATRVLLRESAGSPSDLARIRPVGSEAAPRKLTTRTTVGTLTTTFTLTTLACTCTTTTTTTLTTTLTTPTF